MKLKNISIGILFMAVAFYACDEIAQPLVPKQQNSILPNTTPNFVDSSATSGAHSYKQYKMLLEDCMGNRCSNCPNAAEIADTLISPTGGNSKYGQIVMMEENMGGFATPNTIVGGYPSYAFSTDYRCYASNTWCNTFDFGGSTPYPVGMINRRGWVVSSPSNLDKLYPTWLDTVNAIFTANPPQIFSINIHDSCWLNPRIIGATFHVNALTTLSGSYYLVTAIVESPIISWQENDLVTGLDSTYHHTNVLRGTFGNNSGGLPWGVAIPTSVTSGGGSWSSFQTYDFTLGENGNAAGWNMANCYIVAFIYNQANYEVMQAEIIKVE